MWKQPMSLDVLTRHAELATLCRRYGVSRLDLFGSAATGTDRPGLSHLDFLVEFKAPSRADYADNYFDLKEALRTTLRTSR